jgi:hypothetical protein
MKGGRKKNRDGTRAIRGREIRGREEWQINFEGRKLYKGGGRMKMKKGG